MTPKELAAALGCTVARAERWAEPLTAAMDEYGIDTPARRAAFLAQIGHESGRLQYTLELWGPTGPQARYEGRKDLGNTQSGDGYRYRGRGLIQITGRANYRAVGQALGEDFENRPELLQTPAWAARSAAWYWHARGLNALADRGDIDGISDIINRGRATERYGDANGFLDRLALWNKAKEAIA